MTPFSRKLSSKHVYIRPLRISDCSERYLSWLNDPETNKFLETRKENMEGLIEYVKIRIGRKDVFFGGVFDRQTGLHIGNVKFEPIDLKNKSAVFGILIGESGYRGRGIGTESTILAVKYAFDLLGLKEVRLGVIADNLAARRAYIKAGFKEVETKKNSIRHGERTFDEIIMSIKKE